LLSSCDLLGALEDLELSTSSQCKEFTISEDSFTFKWDGNDDVVSFKIYYREHTQYGWNQSQYGWNLLGETEDTADPEYTINSNNLDYGIYDIGISAVSLEGVESLIHTSLDDTASPDNGWYINWTGSD
jgi:hypothetical protein